MGRPTATGSATFERARHQRRRERVESFEFDGSFAPRYTLASVERCAMDEMLL